MIVNKSYQTEGYSVLKYAIKLLRKIRVQNPFFPLLPGRVELRLWIFSARLPFPAMGFRKRLKCK